MPVLKMFSAGCSSVEVKIEGQALVLVVCYVPPESSSCGRSAEEVLQALSGVVKCGSLGTLVICGYFNARWDLAVEDLGGWFENDVKVTETPQRRTRLIVPGNYLEDNVETIKKLEARVSQEALDQVHEDWW